MKAYCTKGHERVDMFIDRVRNCYVCGQCYSILTREQIVDATPREYHPSHDPRIATLQGMMNYEIVGVNTDDGIFIELPKRDLFTDES